MRRFSPRRMRLRPYFVSRVSDRVPFSDNRSLPFHWHFSDVLRSPGLLLLQRLQAARAQPHERLDYAHDDGHKPAPGS
jgi:hypothetical protein